MELLKITLGQPYRLVSFAVLLVIFYVFGPDYLLTWPETVEDPTEWDWISLVSFHIYWMAIFLVGIYARGSNNKMVAALFAGTATIEYAIYFTLADVVKDNLYMLLSVQVLACCPFFLIAFYRVDVVCWLAKNLGKYGHYFDYVLKPFSALPIFGHRVTRMIAARPALAYRILTRTRVTELELMIMGIMRLFLVCYIVIAAWLYVYAMGMGLGIEDRVYATVMQFENATYLINDGMLRNALGWYWGPLHALFAAGHPSYLVLDAILSNSVGLWWIIAAYRMVKLEARQPDALL
ncbi:hypothetical protein [Bowmanella denitrificans]|uniref:hypothetical protein n=1 Tax=Bowmanella denitrificans TaxID=366582 RepID=UPI000C9C0D74|nr:hypothetical protein [Bowmanella denitrificans]